jgi:hypothetical protein
LVTDWTVILTAVGTAVVTGGLTGGLGYFGIRRSTDVTRYQVEEESARAYALSQAENERLRAQHREDHLRNRQGTYHNLITADQDLQFALGQGIGDPNVAVDQFRHLGNGAVLFGSAAVKDAVTALLAQYLGVVRDAQEIAGDEPLSPAHIRTAFANRWPQSHPASTAMIEAMREDVGPKDDAG